MSLNKFGGKPYAYLIADGLILAVLLLFRPGGRHRGFILSLCGLLAVLVAFVGASFAARTLSPMVRMP